MARAGLCSRREAEAWVLAGRVSVNGEVLASPAYNVSERDDVRVDGQVLRERERTRLFSFHKPRGLVTTARDPEGRPTIFDALPPDLPRVVAVGRLDINTEGLILLTNDGGLARILELPSTGWLRRYRVRAHGAVEQSALDALREGVSIEGIHYAGIEARLERQQGANVWLSMGLREGKNREIKRVLEHLGLSVNRLIRVSFGPFELGDLGEREVEESPTRVLRDQLGPKLAREAGVDFPDAPESSTRTPVAAPPPARADGIFARGAPRNAPFFARRSARTLRRARATTGLRRAAIARRSEKIEDAPIPATRRRSQPGWTRPAPGPPTRRTKAARIMRGPRAASRAEPRGDGKAAIPRGRRARALPAAATTQTRRQAESRDRRWRRRAAQAYRALRDRRSQRPGRRGRARAADPRGAASAR